MDFNQFIDKTVKTKQGDIGTVIAIDKENIDVSFNGQVKTYNYIVAFKNGFLSFVDDTLNFLIGVELGELDKNQLIKEMVHQVKHLHDVKRNEEVTTEYKRLKAKQRTLKYLFGYDFVYPPYKEFYKKNKLLIDGDF